MVVVTNNISVTPQPSADSPHTVKRSVSSPPEELVSLEEVRKISRFKRNEDDTLSRREAVTAAISLSYLLQITLYKPNLFFLFIIYIIIFISL